MTNIKTFGDVKSAVTTSTPQQASNIADKLRSLERNRQTVSTVAVHNEVKPILTPTVKATLTTDEETAISTALKSLGFNDFSLTPFEKSRILFTKNEIKVTDHQYITNYGTDINSEEIIEKLTKLTQTTYADNIRVSLTKIMANIKRVDIDAIFNPNFLKSFFSRSINTREEYIILEKEVSYESNKCKSALQALTQYIPEFDHVELETDKQFRMLSVLIVAAQLRINDEKVRIQNNQNNTDFFLKQQEKDVVDAISRFDRRINNLMLIRQTILMRMSQLRLEENNFLTLIDQTNDILSLVIPTWKQQMISVFSSKSNGNNEYNNLLNIQKELLTKMSNATGAKNDSV